MSDWKSGVGKSANVLVVISNFCGRLLKDAPPQLAARSGGEWVCKQRRRSGSLDFL